jgi:hypothetical protein
VAIRKLGLSFDEVREVLDAVRSLCDTQPLTVDHLDKATEISERYGFSFYDSVIVASALLSGCKIRYSEDLQHRQVIDRQLKVINPFARLSGHPPNFCTNQREMQRLERKPVEYGGLSSPSAAHAWAIRATASSA